MDSSNQGGVGERLVEADEVHKDFGYWYTTSDGIEMVEYYTDHSYPIFAKAQKEFPKFACRES